jgi:hypothetical protein
VVEAPGWETWGVAGAGLVQAVPDGQETVAGHDRDVGLSVQSAGGFADLDALAGEGSGGRHQDSGNVADAIA